MFFFARKQRPALARLARNSNAYRQPMTTAAASATTAAAVAAAGATVTTGSTLEMAVARVHDIRVPGIPQSAMSRMSGSPTVYAR
ncbi:hypothetical protein [Bifidobacterium oedipodis]|uniref:Uncharacterized protein n=1 Tax=Bifidobacterium oedipodis TaxID=2675322 RepID=A0A7Y0EPI0_9BIFI|nr:hypothetical protein [Bifidobacterium sp. DSM 109957]NMM93967.1 hypothetical protein [Bifidobacterium sp. DSM 109957]